jgi:hypothetical protein
MEQRPNQFAIGWAAFSAIIMIMLGAWWMIAGFAALFDDSELFVATSDWAFKLTAPTWGFIHILLGAVLLAAGIGIFRGAEWARIVGAVVAVIGGIVAFAWLPWFPLWAVVYIAGSVAVVWALTVHGADIAGG